MTRPVLLPCRHGVGLVLAVFACGPAALLAQEQADQPAEEREKTAEEPWNILEGIVVDQAGTPVSGVSVVLAHGENSHISLTTDALEAYAPRANEEDDTDRPRRNAKRAVKARTDAEGRFRLKSFDSMDDEYTLVAAKRRGGLALLTKVVPAKHRNEPLKVALHEPAKVKVTVPRYAVPRGGQTHISVQLEPPVSGHDDSGAPEYAEDAVKLYYRFDSGFGSRRAEFGRLIPGLQHRVTVVCYKSSIPYPTTVFEQLVTPKTGEELALFPDPAKDESLPQGATLAGKITDVDGKALKYVNVRAVQGEQRDQVWGGITNAEGQYEIKHLPAGKFRLELEHRRKRTAPG
ncbi:MAG: hypothetical protein AB1716_21345 [Planctomycetota bacterium]